MNQKQILRVNLWLGSWLSRDAVRGANGWSGFMSREVRPHRFFVVTCLALLVCSLAYAQEESERINSNMGASLSLPLSPTSNFVKTSWGLVGGAGYNFSSHHSVIGEFMWSALHPSDAGPRMRERSARSFSRFGQPLKTPTSPATATCTL